MKIAVLGAGIVGLCTAYELVQDGHEVIVFERNASVAQEASFACGGQLSPSLTHPLAFPQWPSGSWLRQMGSASGITLHKRTAWRDLRWLYGWKRAGKGHAEKLAAAHALTAYSLERLHAMELKELLGHEQSQGHMLLWKTEAEQSRMQAQLAAMKDYGLVSQTLTPEEARTIEPALQADFAFHAATHFPQDEVGNCRQMAHLLKDKLTQAGVTLHFNTTVRGLSSAQGIEIHTETGTTHQVQQVVIAAGSGALALAPGSKHLPLTNLWSYSLSAPIREPLNAPRSAVHDVHARTSVSRLGARVRVCGGAELGAPGPVNHARTVKQLYRTLNTLFPGAADFSRNAQIWKGCSQFTPDGLPLIGPSSSPGIWLNTGHGHNGWSMACGSARIVADLMGGKQPDLDASNFHTSRFDA